MPLLAECEVQPMWLHKWWNGYLHFANAHYTCSSGCSALVAYIARTHKEAFIAADREQSTNQLLC